MSSLNTTPRIGFVSLGCPKALVDSERILTELRTNGYELVGDYEGANLVIVNTCGFIDSAKQESLEAIAEALDQNGKVIVTGCMGRDEETIRDVHPSVLAVTGPQAYEEVISAVRQAAPWTPAHDPLTDLVPPQGIKLTPRHYAYLKISEGCNHRCSFCIIPHLRGDLVSRPIGEVMEEAERLARAGVRELLVVSQDTSAYGVDIRYRTGFWQGRPLKTRMTELCAALADLGIWVRLHYVYPYPHVDEVIPLMAEGKILPYLDIPFQHANKRILKQMKRPANSANTLETVRRWRELCPQLTIRSTFIVGFPGETEEEFEELLGFLEEAKLDRVGCFKYSPVEGAPANDLANHVSEEVKEQRWHRLMALQSEISAEILKKRVGDTIEVLIDSVDEEGAIARSAADAPDIDGVVHLPAGYDISPGDFINVIIEEADEYDLYGSPVQ